MPVDNLGEVRQAKALLKECKTELQREGKQVAELLPVGIMVETPAAAVTADILAREVDFMRIGVNELSERRFDSKSQKEAFVRTSGEDWLLRVVPTEE